jgi:hypothetical protein
VARFGVESLRELGVGAAAEERDGEQTVHERSIRHGDQG